MNPQANITTQLAPVALAECTREQVDLLKSLVIKGSNVTDSEVSLFLTICRNKGLDPFSGQIYGIKRKQKDDDGNYRSVLTIQVGIDGFRSRAESSGEYVGQDPLQWCGKDGVWKDVWLDANPPVAARASIHRKGFAVPMVRVALMIEYRGNTPLWSRMPANQLGKCAEAAAFRAAFPELCGNMYANEEMDQADIAEPEPQKPPEDDYVIPVKAIPAALAIDAPAPVPAPAAPQETPAPVPAATPNSSVGEELTAIKSRIKAATGFNPPSLKGAMGNFLRGWFGDPLEGEAPVRSMDQYVIPMRRLDEDLKDPENLLAFKSSPFNYGKISSTPPDTASPTSELTELRERCGKMRGFQTPEQTDDWLQRVGLTERPQPEWLSFLRLAAVSTMARAALGVKTNLNIFEAEVATALGRPVLEANPSDVDVAISTVAARMNSQGSN